MCARSDGRRAPCYSFNCPTAILVAASWLFCRSPLLLLLLQLGSPCLHPVEVPKLVAELVTRLLHARCYSRYSPRTRVPPPRLLLP